VTFVVRLVVVEDAQGVAKKADTRRPGPPLDGDGNAEFVLKAVACR
jgi:hypothetical protein